MEDRKKKRRKSSFEEEVVVLKEACCGEGKVGKGRVCLLGREALRWALAGECSPSKGLLKVVDGLHARLRMYY